MLYHDMENKLMIWMDPEGNIDPNELDKGKFLFARLEEDYQYRIVSSRNEMVEKILVFDADLDDKPLEMFKYYIRETHLSKDDDPDETVLYFGGRGTLEDEGEVVFINTLTGPDQKSFRVPIDKYQQTKYEYTDHYPGPMPEAGAGTLRVTWDTVPAPDLAGFRLRYGTDGVNFAEIIDLSDADAIS